MREKGRIRGWGAKAPAFELPEGFEQRLGRDGRDFHYSGAYEAGSKRIGFLRIPHFSPGSETSAERELRNEIAWMEENTDGLVVDVTRNTGGGCYGETALRLLIPYPFRSIADEVRPSRAFIVELEGELAAARAFGGEEWEIAMYEFTLEQVRRAYSENRGRTGPIPTCQSTADLQPATDASGRILAYSKPLILLTDEFTVSWGEAVAAAMQDARRGPLVGMRTDGAGGMVLNGPAGFYSEASTSYTISMGARAAPVVTPDFPTTAYIENVGVRPDVEIDWMTRENLLSSGRPFVEGFTAAMLDEIAKRGEP
jgi:C-terminal processing protease CtpA/Prc